MKDLTSAAVGTLVAVPTTQSIELAFVTYDAIDGLQADTCAFLGPKSSAGLRVCLKSVGQLSLSNPAQVQLCSWLPSVQS